MKIYHFYHIYADGQWKIPVDEHFLYLNNSFLMENIETMFVGIIGSDSNRYDARDYLESLGLPNLHIVSESAVGWEQETLSPLHDFSLHHKEDVVFYAHTKGASKKVTEYPSVEIDQAWRREMSFHNIERWQTAVWHMTHKNCDTVGILSQVENGKLVLWAGNYWWATCRYIAGLPPISSDNPNRAEDWIGLSEHIKMFDMHKGHPSVRYFNNGLRTEHNIPFS